MLYLLIAIFLILTIGCAMIHIRDYTAPIPGAEGAIEVTCYRLLTSLNSDNLRDVTALYQLYVDTRSISALLMVLELQPENGWTSREVFILRQVQAFYSKRDQIPGFSCDRKAAALKLFFESECRNRITNKMLDSRGFGGVAPLLHEASRKISRCLGPVPRIHEFDFGFGPGATVGVSKNTSVRFKLDAPVTCTVGAASRFSEIAHQYPHWTGLSKPVPVLGGYWTTVPKTFKTERGIVVEPTLNAFMQKGVGSYIRQRLLRVGINTRDQSVNQLCALTGSKEGWLATIDLSNASDTISRNLVRELLPREWWELLTDLRSPYTQMPDGKWVHNEKFSSMGNGFTFELETLIFWAIATSVADGVYSVYGDDIIVESAYFDVVITALESVGFQVNKAKSFGSGPFRESCGKDYWDGDEVRPCYLRSELSIKELYRLYNWAARSGHMDASWFLEFIPVAHRHFGPDGFGDGHLIDLNFRRSHDKRGWEVFEFSSFVSVPRYVKLKCRSDFGAVLYLSGSDFTKADPAEFDPYDIRDVIVSRTLYQERAFVDRFKLRKLRISG